MTVPTPSTDREQSRRRLGTIDDVLAVLPLARNTVYDAARLGKMPGIVKVGRRVLFDLDKVEAWLDEGGGSLE